MKCCGKSAFVCECSVTPPPGTVTAFKESSTKEGEKVD